MPLDASLIPDRATYERILAVSPAAAAELMLSIREAARRSYACFLRYWLLSTNQPFMWNWHWDYLADIMQAVADRDPAVRFLIVNIPPRHAKSTLISQMWHAWMLGREDTRRSSLLSTSCTATLAIRDSRRTLEVLQQPWYQALFPHVRVGNRKMTENEWETDGGAYRIAVGVGGTIIGRGADHITVDDPLKPEDSNSETVREKTNEWLGETLRSRLDDQKTGTITLIMQRLHELDPTGYLLERSKLPGADRYLHIRIPLIAEERTVVSFRDRTYAVREPGDLLHPEYIDRKAAEAIRISQRHNFEGQYQQNPVKMVGSHLDPRRLIKLPHPALELKSRFGLKPVFYIDFAATEKQTQKDDPDYSVIVVVAKDQLQRLHILDIWRRQTPDYASLSRVLIEMHQLWKPRFVKGEKGALLNVFQPILASQQRLAGYFFALEPLPARQKDKVERSMALQGMLNAGVVCVPEAAPWLPDLERELRAFPNGAHDDQVDPLSDAAAEFPFLPQGDAADDPTKGVSDMKLYSDYVKSELQRRLDEMALATSAEDW